MVIIDKIALRMDSMGEPFTVSLPANPFIVKVQRFDSDIVWMWYRFKRRQPQPMDIYRFMFVEDGFLFDDKWLYINTLGGTDFEGRICPVHVLWEP